MGAIKTALAALKGHKRVLVLLVYVGIGAAQAMTGKNLQGIADAIFGPDSGTAAAGSALGLVAATLWALGSYAIDLIRQWNAGATAIELGSIEGWIKEGIAAGRIRASRDGRVTLTELAQR